MASSLAKMWRDFRPTRAGCQRLSSPLPASGRGRSSEADRVGDRILSTLALTARSALPPLQREREDHITFFDRPQVLSADQMPRSSRKRSIGADDLIELMR